MINSRKQLLSIVSSLDEWIKDDNEPEEFEIDKLTDKQAQDFIDGYQTWLSHHTDGTPKDFVHYLLNHIRCFPASGMGRFLGRGIISPKLKHFLLQRELEKAILTVKVSISRRNARGSLTSEDREALEQNMKADKYNELEQDIVWTMLYDNSFAQAKIIKEFAYKFLHNNSDLVTSQPFLMVASRFEGDETSMLNIAVNTLNEATNDLGLFNSNRVQWVDDKELKIGEAPLMQISVPNKRYLLEPLTTTIYGETTDETFKRLWGDGVVS